MGFGDLNVPVDTWGDYMEDVGTYGKTKLPGQSYGFVIEYEADPTGSDNSAAAEETDTDSAEPLSAIMFQLEAWADNWFAAYLGEELIVEDSVSITTERSFNAETATFEASYPLYLNFILKAGAFCFFCRSSQRLRPQPLPDLNHFYSLYKLHQSKLCPEWQTQC